MKALAFLVIALAVACVYALPTNNEQAELAPAMIAKNEGSSESLSLAQEALQLAQHSVNFRKKLKKLLKEGVPTADQIKALINDEVALSTETIHYELRQERNHLVKEVKDGIELLSEGLAFELAAYKDQPMPDEVKAKIAIIEDNIGKLKDRLAVHEADAASSTGVAEETTTTPAVDTVTAEEVASLPTEASTAEQLLGGTAPVDQSTAEAAIGTEASTGDAAPATEEASTGDAAPATEEASTGDAAPATGEEEESSSTAEATEEPSSSTADAAAPTVTEESSTGEEEESSSTAEATEEPSSTADAAAPTVTEESSTGEEEESSSTVEATEEPSSTADAAAPTVTEESSTGEATTADESSSTGEEATDDSSSTGVDGESSSSGADASASH